MYNGDFSQCNSAVHAHSGVLESIKKHESLPLVAIRMQRW